MDIPELKKLKTNKANLEAEIRELTESIEKKTIFQFFARFKQKRNLRVLVVRSARIGETFNNELDNFLLQEHKEFSRLIELNRTLLTKNEFVLNVYKTGYNYAFNSSEQEFAGHIHNNGFLYLTVIKTKITSDFGTMHMPREFVGGFNEYGDYTARATKTKFTPFMPKIPQCYRAQGKSDYTFTMLAGDTEWDLNGNEFVEKMVGDPFLGDEQDREQFLTNRKLINAIRNEFLNAL